MDVLENPKDNLNKIKKLLCKAKKENTDIVVLPEMCCCPYEDSAFVKYAMTDNDYFLRKLSYYASEKSMIIVAGSVPEKTSEGIYNTTFVFDIDGRIIARHRKVHLFDINIKDGQYFKESDTLTPGDSATVFDTEFGKIGLCICFDIRFPEIFRRMVLEGADIVLVPAAFNMTTGPAHWELTFRARALDNQIFVFGTSPARDLSASYQAFGHSIAVSPWGRVLNQMDEHEGMQITTIDLDEITSVREQLPLLKTRMENL